MSTGGRVYALPPVDIYRDKCGSVRKKHCVAIKKYATNNNLITIHNRIPRICDTSISMKQILITLLLMVASVAPSYAIFPNEEVASAEQTMAPEIGNTAEYHTDSVLPVDVELTQAEVMATDTNVKLSQKERADQLAENDRYGFSLTLMSMCIVVSALVILSILFLIFGRISSAMQKTRKKKAHGEAAQPEHEDEDSGEVIAAIAAAMAEHFSGKHDIEDYILTIRSMKRSYSPWNSKIYNLRVLPQVKH